MFRPDVTRGHLEHDPARRSEVRKLRELITALDRRAPQVQRAGELAIARTGQELRAAALRRLDQLERRASRSASIKGGFQ